MVRLFFAGRSDLQAPDQASTAIVSDHCPMPRLNLRQSAFQNASKPGRVSGEIIAGVEPIEAIERGIDRIVNAGAFPTVCIFRPTAGSEMENVPPPEPEAMKEVFAHLHESCRRAGLPVGILPIEVSLVVQPEETADLVAPNLASEIYALKNRAMRQLAKPYVAWKRRPRGSRAEAMA